MWKVYFHTITFVHCLTKMKKNAQQDKIQYDKIC